MLDSGFITPLDFGATGDGVADDTLELQKALDSTYNVIDLAGKTYKVTAQLTLTRSDVILRNGKITYGGTQKNLHSILYVYGSTGGAATHAITANTKIGSNVVTVHTDNIVTYAVGDWVNIVGTTDITSNSSSYYHGELHKIVSINNTAGTFETLSPMVGNMKTAHSVTVQKQATVLENIVIDNLTITGNGVTSTTLSNALDTSSGSSNVVVNHSAHGLVNTDEIYIAQAATTNAITGAQLKGKFAVSSVSTNAYTITTTGTADATATGGGGTATSVTYGQNRGILVALAHNLKVSNCTFKSMSYGIEIDHVNVASIHSNIFTGPSFPRSSSGVTVYGHSTNVRIFDNKIFYVGQGIKIGGTTGTTSNVYVYGNTLNNIEARGILTYYNTKLIKIRDNTISHRNRFTDDSNWSYGVLVLGWEGEVIDNSIEGFTYVGIRYVPRQIIDTVYGDTPTSTSSEIATSYNPFPSITIKGNRLMGSHTTKASYGVWLENAIKGEGHVTGTRLSDNYIYGCHTNVFFNNETVSGSSSTPGFKDTIVTGNIFLGTPNSSTATPHGIRFANDSGSVGHVQRTVLSNNIFDTRASVADLGTASLIDFRDGAVRFDFSNSSVMGNILTASAPIAALTYAMIFASTTSDTTQTTERVTLLGNNFLNYSDKDTAGKNMATFDILQYVTASDKSLMVGTPVGNHAADTGAYWGLNMWGNTDSTTWAGTT